MLEAYKKVIEKTKEIGGIDIIGVVSEPGQTAICFSGVKTLARYCDGNSKASMLMQISGAEVNNKQDELVNRLCGIGKKLEKAMPEIKGIAQPKYKISSYPIPTMHNERYWVYSMTVEVIFYTRKD